MTHYIIKDEVFDMAKDFIIKSVLSKLKEKYFSFIKENFIDRLLSLFDECFDKIGKTIDFACDEIGSAKNYINDIVSSFMDLVENIRKMSNKNIMVCRNTINIEKNIKDFKITEIPEFFYHTKEIIDLFVYIKTNLKFLPK